MDRQPPLHALLAHAGFVRAIARSLLRDEHDAEDVVQETFLAALEHPPADRGKLRAWLGAVGRRRALKTRRAERRRKERERVAARPEAVASFTGAFYQNWLGDGMPLPLAYRDAIGQTRSEFPSFRDWSAFQLIANGW